MSLDVQSTNFGKNALKDFLFAKNWLNLNHGSFGTYPLVVRKQLRQFQDMVESKPDPFIRYTYPTLLDQSRAALASNVLNCPVGDVVFIPNATTGINTVLRNLTFREGDVIIYFATIYGACEKSVTYITETTPAKSYKILYTFPVSDAFLVGRLESVIKELRAEGMNPRIAIFDTVVSMPGVRLPYERLTEVCRQTGVLSCIDGAHAVGMLSRADLDMSKLQPDFFVSNCHKWLFVPRGCCVLYVPERNQHLMRSTLPTSHGFQPVDSVDSVSPLPASEKSAFETNFQFVGTIDNSPYLCVPTALAYRQEKFGGEDAIAAHLKAQARRGGDLVAKILGTDVLDNEEGTLRDCAFANVRLPVGSEVLEGKGVSVAVAEGLVRDSMQVWAMDDYTTFIALLWHGGKMYARLSAQVYLDHEDYVKAAEILKQICKRVARGESKL